MGILIKRIRNMKPLVDYYISSTSSALAVFPYPYQAATLGPTWTRVSRRYRYKTGIHQTQRQIERFRFLKKRTAFRPNFEIATSSTIHSAAYSSPPLSHTAFFLFKSHGNVLFPRSENSISRHSICIQR
ncbi:unnamed protein product [Albugo candida]|uniref:Uncharacterized protein n=1 Tax=Albugo candida TaxID=65357 RepID=A0A024GSX8_9STRA|nr:unnamed protein product [Albugo candida]|eukprot:CCI50034.1 unnamed protein product [Albugo candida]